VQFSAPVKLTEKKKTEQKSKTEEGKEPTSVNFALVTPGGGS
jgi:hypothetical protein